MYVLAHTEFFNWKVDYYIQFSKHIKTIAIKHFSNETFSVRKYSLKLVLHSEIVRRIVKLETKFKQIGQWKWYYSRTQKSWEWNETMAQQAHSGRIWWKILAMLNLMIWFSTMLFRAPESLAKVQSRWTFFTFTILPASRDIS